MTNPYPNVTPDYVDRIGELSNTDLLDLHGLARDFQALAMQGTDVHAIRYGCNLKAACVKVMKQRNNGNAITAMAGA